MYCPNDQCPDFIESGHRGEYREGLATCPKCQSNLAPGSAPQPRTPVPANNAGFVVVEVYNTEHEASLALSMLTAHGVMGKVTMDASAWVGISTHAYLLVPEDQAARATRILAAPRPRAKGLRRKHGS